MNKDIELISLQFHHAELEDKSGWVHRNATGYVTAVFRVGEAFYHLTGQLKPFVDSESR